MTIHRLILITIAVIVLVSYLGYDFSMKSDTKQRMEALKKENAVLNSLVDYQASLLEEAEEEIECVSIPFVETSVTLETKMQEWKLLNKDLW